MKKLLFFILTVLVSSFFIFADTETQALELSKGLPHYAHEMEFYYLKPRPEILIPLFENFNKNNVLAKSENRLMLAAFFSELANMGRLSPDFFAIQNRKLDKNARHVLAWTAHLSSQINEDMLLGQLLEADEKALSSQIRHTPRRLLNWPLKSERSVLQMYWAAYMAGGNTAYLDSIIRIALECARPSGYADDSHNVATAAAASLYDLASGHASVRERIKWHLAGKSGMEKKILLMILREGGQDRGQ